MLANKSCIFVDYHSGLEEGSVDLHQCFSCPNVKNKSGSFRGFSSAATSIQLAEPGLLSFALVVSCKEKLFFMSEYECKCF